MLEIYDHQRNANQNHIEISPHNCQNGYHKKKKVDQDMGKRETLYSAGGNEIAMPLLKIVKFLNKLEIVLPTTQKLHSGEMSEKIKSTTLKRYLYPNVHSSIIYNCQPVHPKGNQS